MKIIKIKKNENSYNKNKYAYIFLYKFYSRIIYIEFNPNNLSLLSFWIICYKNSFTTKKITILLEISLKMKNKVLKTLKYI